MMIVQLNETHIGPIAEMEKLCFSDPWSESSIRSELNNPLSTWLVAIEDDQLVGYVGSQTVLGWTDMMNIAVHPDYRRRGIAESLVNSLETALKARESQCLTLEVRVSNEAARALYAKLGFQEVGLRKNYYRHPKEDALILRKEWML